MTKQTDDLIAEARRMVELTGVRQSTVLIDRLADVLEAVIANRDEFRAAWNVLGFKIDRLEAERDAALAVIENVRGLVEMWEWIPERGDVLEALSSVPADVLRERDDRMRGEGWDECFSTAYDGTFVQDPNNPYRTEGFSADMHAIDESEKW